MTASGADLRTEVAVVGGGPAGAIAAERLARAGHDVLVLERSPAYRWRACGVFSWTAMRHVGELGLSDEDRAAVGRPAAALRLVTPDRSEVTLAADDAGGFDRPALDPLLLERTRLAGATVCEGATVTAIGRPSDAGVDRWELTVRDSSGVYRVRAAVVVGADGIRSLVARSAGVVRPARVAPRIGITFHVAAVSLDGGERRETVMTVFRGGYCGIAPVPGGRLNVGIVLDPRRWQARLRRDGAAVTSAAILRRLVARDARLAATVGGFEPLDHVAGAMPLAHAVSRVAGDGWLLAGDAAGFLDPFTGEGLGRAFTTATMAADAVRDHLRGDRNALARYGAAYRRAYTDRDRLTLLLQLFLARPALLSYAVRRLATRTEIRERLQGVLAECLPAHRALEPRFIGALLRP